MRATCSLEGCNRERLSRGWCKVHYERWRRHGDIHATRPARPKTPPIELIMRRVSMMPGPLSTDCWITTYALSNGYVHLGIKSASGRLSLPAHRVTYEHFRGPIPEGLVLDHLCRVTACVNPGHLEAVTVRENSVRGVHPNIVAYWTNTCVRGHTLLDAAIKKNGTRNCRACHAEQQRAYRAARKTAA